MLNMGSITVIRKKQFKGALIPFTVLIDEQVMCTLDQNTQYTFQAPLGYHVVKIRSAEKDVIQEVMLNEQQVNVYIECECKMGLLVGRPNITNVYFG